MGYDWYTTDLDRQPLQEQKQVRRLGHLCALLMIMSLLGAIFFPLWQQGVHRSLQLERQALARKQQTLEEQQQFLRSTLARMMMPEALVYGALQEDIIFQPIVAQTFSLVARGE